MTTSLPPVSITRNVTSGGNRRSENSTSYKTSARSKATSKSFKSSKKSPAGTNSGGGSPDGSHCGPDCILPDLQRSRRSTRTDYDVVTGVDQNGNERMPSISSAARRSPNTKFPAKNVSHKHKPSASYIQAGGGDEIERRQPSTSRTGVDVVAASTSRGGRSSPEGASVIKTGHHDRSGDVSHDKRRRHERRNAADKQSHVVEASKCLPLFSRGPTSRGVVEASPAQGTSTSHAMTSTDSSDDGKSTIAMGILMTSGFVWLPICQPHRARQNSDIADTLLSTAAQCPRWHVRRNALCDHTKVLLPQTIPRFFCDHTKVLLPQTTRESIEKDVSDRKSNLTRKVSQYFRSMYAADYEVDLV